MEDKKFLRYCPNCTHYNQSTGACNYINENVLEYPARFIKFCNGKYLSLIKGKRIKPYNENKMKVRDDVEIIPEMVTVFSQNNVALFQIAKSLLEANDIKFWANAAYGSIVGLTGTGSYNLMIKVFEKDEKAARKILSKLTKAPPYVPSNKIDKKINSFIGRWAVVIILIFIITLIIVMYLLKPS